MCIFFTVHFSRYLHTFTPMTCPNVLVQITFRLIFKAKRACHKLVALCSRADHISAESADHSGFKWRRFALIDLCETVRYSISCSYSFCFVYGPLIGGDGSIVLLSIILVVKVTTRGQSVLSTGGAALHPSAPLPLCSFTLSHFLSFSLSSRLKNLVWHVPIY